MVKFSRVFSLIRLVKMLLGLVIIRMEGKVKDRDYFIRVLRRVN